MSTKTNLGGRPPLPDAERKTDRLQILLTADEKEVLTKAAELHGLTLSEYVRDWLLAEAYAAVNHGSKQAISTMCATAEAMAKRLDVDVEIKPAFKTYKVVDEIAEL